MHVHNNTPERVAMLILLITVLLAFADQVAKYLVRAHFEPGAIRPVIAGFFSLAYVRNTGAAWGILSGLNNWLIVLSVIMLIVFIIFRRSFLTDTLIHRIAAGFMMAGIVGNLIDRFRLGYVVDFLDFHPGFTFPTFNIADAAICAGAGLYIISQMATSNPAPKECPMRT